MSVVTTWTTMLITGLRGNGKTLHAVQLMDQFIKGGVPVFACNFNGLSLPGVQVLDDPNDWRDLPPGAVLFVDETQRFWRARRSGEVPRAIQDMETQRHDGIRMVLLTQQPTYLDKHLRGLVDVHRHLVRRAGLQASQVYEWEKCKEEVDSTVNLDLAEKSIWPFPKEYFGQYTSAEVHTVKPKLPARLKLLAGAVVLIGFLFWFGINKVSPDETDGEQAAALDAAPSAAGDGPASRNAKTLTPEQYVLQMVPRIAGAPWSAPVFDSANKPTDEPVEIACMIGTVCRCMTTQGTNYQLSQELCRSIVRNGGIFNPYKRRDREMDRPAESPMSSTLDPVGVAHADRVPGAVIDVKEFGATAERGEGS